LVDQLDFVAKLLAERRRRGVTKNDDMAFAGGRHAALAQGHLLPQIAPIRPSERQNGIRLGHRERDHLARHPRDAGERRNALDGPLGNEAAENVGCALLHHHEIVAELVHALARAVLDAAGKGDQRQRGADGEPDAEDRQAGADRPSLEIARCETDEVHLAELMLRNSYCNHRPDRGVGCRLPDIIDNDTVADAQAPRAPRSERLVVGDKDEGRAGSLAQPE
jgi:hypothetical protein